MKKLLLISILLFPYLLIGQIIHVPADESTIQAGIDAASDGDTVLVADGNYLENINFNGKAITVASHFILDGDTNHINNTVIDGSQPNNPDYGSVVTFITGEDTTSAICGFTISGGTGTYLAADDWRLGGGVLCYFASAKILNNKIVDNTSEHSYSAGGGGIGCFSTEPGTWVVLRDNTIRGNSSSAGDNAGGGGIFVSYNAIITGNTIEQNHATGVVTDGMGGGLFTQSSASENDTVFIMNNIIRENYASSDYFARGGGIFSVSNYIVLSNNVIHHDSLSGYGTHGGGAIIRYSSYAEIQDNIISQNVVNKINAYWGAGLFLSIPLGPVEITGNELESNNGELSSTGAGGGISIMDGYDYPILVDRNRFINNNSFHGPGFYERNSYNLTLSNNIFIGNNANRGGAIGMFHGSIGSDFKPLIVNNTFYHNSASSEGGSIRFTGDYHSPPVIFNCIFNENQAPSGQDIFNNSMDIIYIAYSNIFDESIEGLWTGMMNIDDDPLFLDPENQNCCIDPCGSPCVAAGADSIIYNNSWFSAPDHDIRDSVRPNPVDTPPDMGAYEVYCLTGNSEVNKRTSSFYSQIYPNPNQGIFNCQLSTDKDQFVSMSLVDLHGREMASVTEKWLKAGDHVLGFNITNLPEGVYFMRIQTGQLVKIKKLLKIR